MTYFNSIEIYFVNDVLSLTNIDMNLNIHYQHSEPTSMHIIIE